MTKTSFYTKKKMINIIAVFWIVVSMILIESITAYAVVNPLPSNESTGISYIVYECDTKQTLLKQNADLPADCSLLARLMTFLLVLENQSISVTDYISPSEDSISASGRYTLLASNQYMVDHLIKSVILCNADNAARALASHVNPNTEYFISIMNQKAKELGMNNTFFINPDGTADQLQRTTIHDMSLFWSYAMTNTQFRNIAANSAAHIWGGTAVLNECRMVSNNPFPSASLTAGSYNVYDSINGLGTTMFYITNKISETMPSVKLTLIITGASTDSSYELGKNYINNVLSNFKKTTLISKQDLVVSAEIGGSELILNAGETCYCMMPVDITNYVENISYTIIDKNAPDSMPGKTLSLEELSPPIEEGSVIGTANYLLKDGSVHKVNLIAGNSIHFENKTINIFYKVIKENTDIFILISVLVLCELILAFCVIFNKLRTSKL